jgi:hypothetical protein
MKKEFDYEAVVTDIRISMCNGDITKALQQYEKAVKRKSCDCLRLISILQDKMMQENYHIFSKYLIARLTVKGITS